MKGIKKEFVVIGGYAVNAYALPRFSVDCDIVVKDAGNLSLSGYKIEESNKNITPHGGKFIRFEKEISKNFRVSVDVFAKEIFDRQTGAIFSADWIFHNSSIRPLKGKTIAEELKLRIINVDALIVMKLISCRNTDIRDIFMLMPKAINKEWIKEEVKKRYFFDNRLVKLKEKITSVKFKDDLQGVYGYIDNNIFDKHMKAVLELEKE